MYFSQRLQLAIAQEAATLAAMSTTKSAHPGDTDHSKSRNGTKAPQSIMSDLLAKSKVAGATPCPNCKTYLPGESVVCTHCGYNTETGKAASTRIVESKTKDGSRGLWPFGRK